MKKLTVKKLTMNKINTERLLRGATMLVVLSACGRFDKNDGHGKNTPEPTIKRPYPQFSITAATYENCDALQADVRELLAYRREEERRYRDWMNDQRWQRDESIMASKAGPASASQAPSAESNDTAGSDGAPEGGGAADESFTNVQEKGVDEADAFKIDAHHLYTAADDHIEVVARDTLTYLGALDIKGLANVSIYTTGAGGDGTGGRLVVLGEVQPDAAEMPTPLMSDVSVPYGPDNPSLPQPMPEPTTEVRIYDAAAPGLPALITTKTYPGTVLDSRSIEGRLILVFSDYLRVDDPAFVPYGGVYGGYMAPWMYSYEETSAPAAENPVRLDDQGTIRGVPCQGIVKPSVRDYDFRMTRVITLDTAAPDAQEHATAVLGGGDQIYMTTSSLYVAKSQTSWFYWGQSDAQAPTEQLVVSRVAFDAATGAVIPAGVGAVHGRVKDQWAFRELGDLASGGALAIATTTGQLWSEGEDKAQNHLWILKANPATSSLDVVSSVNDFGTGEDIRSVRYVGSMAYVVTFKKTDPLFAIDLADLAAPKLLGQLKVPGFSTYMHPAPGGLMIGVGFDATDQGNFAWYQGLQISLFDVADPTAMTRLDVKIHGDRGSYSDATGDHHAFFFDPETSLMAVPMVELEDALEGTSDYGRRVAFSGAVVYRVERTLVETARLSHVDLIPDACRSSLANGAWWQEKVRSLDVNRVFKVDGRLLSFSRFGIRAHPLADPERTEGSVTFPNAESRCQGSQWDYY